MQYKIKEVANLVGISVRTLHHYDEIELLTPTSVTSAGYRIYQDIDLERLQQILFFKELGFSLKEIKEILDSPGFDRKQALLAQQELLIKKKKRLEAIITSVSKTLEALEGGTKMAKKEMFDAFDMSEIENHQKKYAEEAKQKYGHTDAYKESQQKTSNYKQDDWANIMAKSEEISLKLANLMDKEVSHAEVQEAIGEWRQHITDNFYQCTLEIFRGLGDLYVSDERFTANIDKYRAGLAEFMRKGIHHYCDTHDE